MSSLLKAYWDRQAGRRTSTSKYRDACTSKNRNKAKQDKMLPVPSLIFLCRNHFKPEVPSSGWALLAMLSLKKYKVSVGILLGKWKKSFIIFACLNVYAKLNFNASFALTIMPKNVSLVGKKSSATKYNGFSSYKGKRLTTFFLIFRFDFF